MWFKRLGVRLLDHVFHQSWSGLTVFGVGLGISVVVASLLTAVDFLDRGLPQRLEPIRILPIYPSELAAMREDQPALGRGVPVGTVPVWREVPSEHLFALPNRRQVMSEIGSLETSATVVPWPCQADNAELEAIIKSLGSLDGGAGRDNSAIFYHRGAASMLRCSWGQAQRDFDALQRLLDTAEDGRPDQGWENSEPRFWAIRAASEYLNGDMLLRQADHERLKGERLVAMNDKALNHFQAALGYLEREGMPAITRVERTQAFPTTDSEAALLELDSADVLNQMIVASLRSGRPLDQGAWAARFEPLTTEPEALASRPVLALNLQMLALTQGRRRESQIFQPSAGAFDQLPPDVADDLRRISTSVGIVAGAGAGTRGAGSGSPWPQIGSWRRTLAAEDGNPANVLRAYRDTPDASPYKSQYRDFLRDVARETSATPDRPLHAFKAALPRDIVGPSPVATIVLVVGILLATLAGGFTYLVHLTGQPLYGRDHYRDRRRGRA